MIKPFILIVAGALCLSPIAFADPPPHARGEALPPGLAKQGKVPPGHAKKLWGKGQYLPREYREARLEDWHTYDLRPAPTGHRWVHVDRDAYLVETASGLIAEALIGVLVN